MSEVCVYSWVNVHTCISSLHHKETLEAATPQEQKEISVSNTMF